MEGNAKIIEFWNKTYEGATAAKLGSKWIEDEAFNSVIKKYVKENGSILDFGCGSAWSLFEIYYTKKIKFGLGIDASANAIECAIKTAEFNNISVLDFKVGSENILNDYVDYFDCITAFNVLDVVSEQMAIAILEQLKKTLKKDGFLIVGINPSYPLDLLEKLGYKSLNGYLYKNDILRGTMKTNDEWIKLFNKHFTFIEYSEFVISEMDKTYPRRMFILKK